MDVGYYGEGNIRILYGHRVSFLSKLTGNLRLYKTLTARYLPSVGKDKNPVEYNGRYAYIKCVRCKLVDDHTGYAYVCLGIERKGFETEEFSKRAKIQKFDKDEVFHRMLKAGAFVLVFSRGIAIDKILPTDSDVLHGYVADQSAERGDVWLKRRKNPLYPMEMLL